jgi:hypothetical protein
MNIPGLDSITGKKVDESPVTFEGPMFAEVVMPGSSKPTVETIGEISSEAIVIHPADREPHPAPPGSWVFGPPPSEHAPHQQLGGLWAKTKAASKSSKSQSQGPEIL